MFPRGSRTSLAAILAVSVTLGLFALFTLLLTPTGTQAQTQPDALGSLRGVVRNSDGAPLPNITVVLQQRGLNDAGRQATSNSSGGYEFLSLPSGTYTLRFIDPSKHYATRYYVAADFTSDATTVVVNGNNVGNINMAMAPAGSISLTLQSTTPVSMTYFTTRLYRQTQQGAWVTYHYAYLEPSMRQWLYEALPPGNYRLCATLQDQLTYRYATECFDQAVPTQVDDLPSNATSIAVAAGEEKLITIDFDDNSQVEGTVTSPGGTPLPGIVMMLIEENGYFQSTAASDTNGRFHFPAVPDGDYRLLYNVPQYFPNEYLTLYYPNTDSIANAQSIEIHADTHISITQKMRIASQITGKVTLPGDVPVSGVYFAVYRQWSDGTFNIYSECPYSCSPREYYDTVTGAYTLTQLIPGNYRIAATYFLPYGQNQFMQFYGGDSLDQADTIALGAGKTIKNINFVVGEGQYDGAITGRVTADGQPVSGIEVGLFLPYYDQNRAVMPHFATLTDADGRYSLQGLTASSYFVAAHDPEGRYATTFFRQDLTMPNYFGPLLGESVWISGTATVGNIDLALTPGATLRGHVRVQGKSRSDFSVQAVPFNPYYNDPYYSYPTAFSDVRTDATGYYEITGLVSGTYYLRAYEPYGEGEYPSDPLFYPGTYDYYGPRPITVTTGQTLNNIDFWVYNTPTYWIPVIANGPAPEGGMEGVPLAQPVIVPVPVAVPAPAPARR